MRSFKSVLIVFIPALLTFCNSAPQKVQKLRGDFIDRKEIDYPSGSTINYHHGKLYLMGDDAQFLVVLDTLFNYLDSVPVFRGDANRFSKPVKADIESSDFIGNDFWLLGSGSLSPYRDSLFKINISTHSKQRLSLKAIYDRLDSDMENINIEAFAKVKERVLLGNRRNSLNAQNYLISMPMNFSENQNTAPVKIIPFVPGNPEAGLSGITYFQQTDMLFITCSIENTKNSYEDGTIGESFLGMISEVSSKLTSDSLKVNQWISLNTIDKSFNNRKVESVTISEFKNGDFFLYLSADNDNGKTVLYKVKLTIIE